MNSKTRRLWTCLTAASFAALASSSASAEGTADGHDSAGLLLGAPFALSAEQSAEASFEQAQLITSFELFELSSQHLELSLSALGENMEISLRPNRALFASLQTIRRGDQEISVEEAGFSTPYTGTIEGKDHSWVRLSMINGEPQGLLYDGDKLYEIRNHGDGLTIAPAGLAYSDKVAKSIQGGASCGLTEHSPSIIPAAGHQNEHQQHSFADHQTKPLVEECVLLPISLALDHVFVGRYGGAEGAESRAMSKMNEVDALYRDAVNVGFRIISMDVYPDAGGPDFNQAGDPGAQGIVQMAQKYKENPENEPVHTAGLFHVMTSRYSFGALGFAYQGGICASAGWAVSFSSDTSDLGWLITAHELGHNFGCPHDGSASQGEDCSSAGGGYLMQPTASPGANKFSECSKGVINDNVTRAMAGNHKLIPGSKNCFDPCVGCGNGIVEDGEFCDDGNDIDDDECPNDCSDPNPPMPNETSGGDSGPDSSGEGPDPSDSGNDTDPGNEGDGGTSGGGEGEGGSGGSDGSASGGGGQGNTDTGATDGNTTSPTTGGFGGDETGFGAAEDDSDGGKGCSVLSDKSNKDSLIFSLIPFALLAFRRRKL